jgi:hypothetical protein
MGAGALFWFLLVGMTVFWEAYLQRSFFVLVEGFCKGQRWTHMQQIVFPKKLQRHF